MNGAPAPVDWTPMAQVMLVGLLLASAVVAVLWLRRSTPLRSRRDWRRALAFATLFLTFDLVVFGAFTRLTDSGLGCPDWPGCYGSASPLGAHAEIQAAQTALPSGPVTHHKAWIEMVHRYLATGVGALILAMTVLAWLAWRDRKGAARVEGGGPWLPTFTLAWVCLQGAFGAWTVTMKLFPLIVTLHLLGGLVLLALLAVQAQRWREVPPAQSGVPLGSGTRRWLVAASALLWTQIALGGWVSTNYAVLACTDFPRCHGSWWPEMQFGPAFQLWRELGMTADGQLLSLQALTAIHYTHRLMAYAVLAVLAVLALRLIRHPATRRNGRWLAGLAALQLASGLSNVVLGWPLFAALLHTAGAAALVLVLTWTLAQSRATQPRTARDAPLHSRSADAFAPLASGHPTSAPAGRQP